MRPAERMAGIAFVSMLLAIVASTPVWASVPAAEGATAHRVSAPSATASTAEKLPDAQTQSYRNREAQHPESANFRGGDSVGIYIGGSAGLLVVVLLVLLLLR